MEDRKLSRYFFVAVLIGTAVLFFRMVRLFFLPVLLAAVFATLFYPLYEWLLKALRGRKTLASFLCCLLLLLVLVVPLYLVAEMVTREAIDFYRSAQGNFGDIGQKLQAPLLRLRGLPVHIVHGRLDWMFPVQVARQTSQALSAAGAKVTYRELDDLSHTYPREMNAEILQWLNGPRA